MKLFWKTFLFALILISVALSLASYLLITASYKNAVAQEKLRVMDQYQYAKFVLQANLINQRVQRETNNSSESIFAGFPKLAEENLSSAKAGNFISIFDENRTRRYSTFSAEPDLKISDYDLDQEIVNLIKEIDGSTYIMALGKITQNGQTLYLLSATDIQQVIDQKAAMVRDYSTIYFITIGFAIVLVILFSTVLTRPIRKMSVAAARIADGKYSERLKVFANDEIGDLAKRFNMMAEAIEERILALSKAAKEKEDFVANFAHELKTPLTSVIGYADMIYQKPLSREDIRKAAAYIMDEGLRLEALSFKLMDLIVLNKQDFVLEELPADELLQNIADTLKPMFVNENIKFCLEAAKFFIKVDYDLFKTLLLNLIDNAVKAGSTEIILTGRIEQKNYLVRVSDNGCGIPAEKVERITESFYMVDKSRSRKQHGVGLGLALAAKIAEIHGSRLKFNSASGKGTTVSLFLPLEGCGGSA
jgi:signal transduction histidine kinase